MIEELRRLLAGATPGPWSATNGVLHRGPQQLDFGSLDRHTDAVLVVAAVNALPSLLAELEAAEAVVEAARATLHGPTGWGGPATEPLSAALRRYEETVR